MARTFQDRGWQDRIVNIKRVELLDILKANRTRHIDVYKQACLGYHKLALAKSEEEFKKLKRTIESLYEGKEFMSGIFIQFSLPAPVSHEKTYNQAIRMTELEVKDVIELTADQFSCFVMDDWEWTHNWKSQITPYFGGIAAQWTPEAKEVLE